MSHSLDSWLLYVHPPLAIIAYILTFTLLFSLVRYRKDKSYRGVVEKVGWAAWTFNFLGLVTGMIWAQISWGRPFGFDPKETFTLLLFISVGLNMYLFHRGAKIKWLLTSGISSCLLIFLTIIIPLFLSSLHGYP
jgi:ABC-type transport system involved in cytochrome c biogenesis permease subunit